jgi:hypothetical protein
MKYKATTTETTARNPSTGLPSVFESPKGTDYHAIKSELGDIITLRRSSDGYVEARTFCKHYEGDWRNDFDNTNPLKKGIYGLASSVGVAQHKMVCVENRGTHHPVWVHPLIAGLILAKYDPNDAEAAMDLVQDVKKLQKVDTLIDIFSDDGHLITQQRKSDGYCDLGIAYRASEYKARKLSKFMLTAAGRKLTKEFVELFLQTQKNEVGVFHGVWGHPKTTIAFAKYSSISLKDDINIELASKRGVSPITVDPVSDVDELDTLASRVSGLVLKAAFRNLRDKDGKFVTTVRGYDGMVCATMMCSSSGLMWRKYNAYRGSDNAIINAARMLGVHRDTLVKSCKGLHTYMHVLPAVDLARYCGYGTALLKEIIIAETVGVDNMDDDVEEYNSNYKPLYIQDGQILTVLRISDNMINVSQACEFIGQFFGDFATNGKTVELFAYLRQALGVQILVSGEDGQQWLHRDASPQFLAWCFKNNKDMHLTLESYTLLKDVDFKGVEMGPTEEKPDGPTLIPAIYPQNFIDLEDDVVPFLLSLRGNYGEIVTEMRVSDGLINANRMCKSNGRSFSAFKKDGGGGKFLTELADELDMVVMDDNTESDKFPLVKWSGSHTRIETWVHPRVAIRLAQWTGIKFAIKEGSVPVEQLQAVARATLKRTVKTRPPPITYDQITRFKSDEDTSVVPLHCKPPNTGYLLRLGVLPDGSYLDEWGMTSNFPTRYSHHLAEHPGCQIVMVINVGTQQPKHLEDTMRNYFRDKERRVQKPSGKKLKECFVVSKEDESEYFESFLKYIIKNLSDSIEVISYEGEIVYEKQSTTGITHNIDTATLLEIEKLKLLQERERTAQEREKTAQQATLTR